MKNWPVVTLAALLVLGGCATTKTRPAVPSPTSDTQARRPESPIKHELFRDLKGWEQDDHSAAFEAYRATCQALRDTASLQVCRRAMSVDMLDGVHARAFFEDNFDVEAILGTGILTAYFAPEYEARSKPDNEFSAPVRAKPRDLVTDARGAPKAPYPDRASIETQGASDALAWMRPEELFFLQIQGSGILTFPDGRRSKALYAANNGRPFVGIANPMRDQGLLAGDNTSGDSIARWLASHRGPQAQAIMWLNPRYVFFRMGTDDGLPPVGAAGLPLPAGRAVALDLSRHTLGQVFWIDGTAPILSGAFPQYRRLVMGLDTGGAIKGEVRADLYLGQGRQAGVEAGRVRHTLRLHRLVPKP